MQLDKKWLYAKTCFKFLFAVGLLFY